MQTRRHSLAISLAILMSGVGLIGVFSAAHADKTVIDGPGFKMEQKDGWFGTSQKIYTDALGNTYVKKKGLFGRSSKKSKLFGSEVVQKGDNLSVKAPDGTPLVTRKKKLFGGRETHVNANGMWDAVAGLMRGAPAGSASNNP